MACSLLVPSHEDSFGMIFGFSCTPCSSVTSNDTIWCCRRIDRKELSSCSTLNLWEKVRANFKLMWRSMPLFLRLSKKLHPNQQTYTIPTVILQLQNSTAWKVLRCFQHGLVTLLVRLWQLLWVVSPTGGADIPGTLVHSPALPIPGQILPENQGVQIAPASRERGLFSTFLYSGCENTHTTQHYSLAAVLTTCEMFLSVLAYSWFLLVARHFFRRMMISFFCLNARSLFLLHSPVIAIWSNLFFP